MEHLESRDYEQYPASLPVWPGTALSEPLPVEHEEAAPALSTGLRPYQARAVQDVLNAGQERVLVVIPTAGGKSLVIAEVARIAAMDGSVLVLTHRRELVAQNAVKIMTAMGGSDHVGIYSAGLRTKTVRRVTVGGIQSMARIPEALIRADTTTVIVDEAHRVAPHERGGRELKGQYADLLSKVRSRTGFPPQLVGLTATPFRGDTRETLVDAGAFDAVVHETEIGPLVKAGWLAPLRPRVGCFSIDESALQSVGDGDFTVDSQEAEILEAVDRIADDVCSEGARGGYRKWVLFLPTIATCKLFTAALNARGAVTRTLTSEVSARERDDLLADFRRPDSPIRCVSSCNILSEGFDVADIDLIALIRATKSPTLFVQACGRGTRIADGKGHCRVIDYGKNFERHGPLDDLRLSKPTRDEPGDAPVKICQPGHEETGAGCGALVPTAVRVCPECGEEFPPPKRVVFQGDGEEIEALARAGLAGFPDARIVRVAEVRIDPHISRAGNSMVRVGYHGHGSRHMEYLFPTRTRHGFKGQRYFRFMEQVCPDIAKERFASFTVPEAVQAIRESGREVLYVWWQPQPSNPQWTETLSRICRGDPLPQEPARTMEAPGRSGQAAAPAPSPSRQA